MIHSVEVEGLRGIEGGRASFRLGPGLNIITGQNGSGKTTLLKLMWYLLSGNIEQALAETPFTNVKIKTDAIDIEIDNKSPLARVYRLTPANEETREIKTEYDEDGDPLWFDLEDGDAENFANGIISNETSSLFFPTFRRIEGGFGLNRRSARSNPLRTGGTRAANNVEMALEELSRRLSNSRHTFICSVSTSDIANILLQRYAEVSEQSNLLQTSVSQKIIDMIRLNNNLSFGDQGNEPEKVLQEVLEAIERSDRQREKIFEPIEAVRQVVSQIFLSKSISIGQRLNFGDAATAVASDVLSAGEKQMLSFLCYNALYTETIMFIDEPELSLHVDWQRLLFSTLERQSTNNQFIIATHSPFIYAKYPDREIQISSHRGDELPL